MSTTRAANRPQSRPTIYVDFDREIESTFRSIHRRLVICDDLVRQMETDIRHLQHTMEYFKEEMERLKQYNRRKRTVSIDYSGEISHDHVDHHESEQLWTVNCGEAVCAYIDASGLLVLLLAVDYIRRIIIPPKISIYPGDERAAEGRDCVLN